MSDQKSEASGGDLRLSMLQVLGTLFAAGFVLFADYPVAALGAIIALIFVIYIWVRVLVFLDNNRFSPRQRRVGMTWALLGIDRDTSEYDIGPVRVYCALLLVLFMGGVLRPIVTMIV